MNPPGWYPDPAGRHELRWYDGTTWSDQVADAGVQSTDPGAVLAGAGGVVPPADVTGRKANRLPIILAVAGALLVAVAVVTLLSDDDGGASGTGTFEGEVDGGGEGTHEVSVPAGSVLVVEVDPDGDFDAIVAFQLDGDDAERIADAYENTPFPDTFDGDEVFIRDSGFEGDRERTFLAAPFDVDATVVVSGFEGSEGRYEIEITAYELEVDDDPDGEDLLDAIVEDDEVPRALRRDIEDFREAD